MEFFISNQDAFLAVASHCHDMLDENKTIKIVVTDSSKRSLSQNSLLWLWYGEIASGIKRKTGESYTSDDLHEYFKARFCPSKELKFGGKVINAVSTTRLDTGEMTFFLNQVHEWSVNAGFNLTIPINSEYREMIERQVR